MTILYDKTSQNDKGFVILRCLYLVILSVAKNLFAVICHIESFSLVILSYFLLSY